MERISTPRRLLYALGNPGFQVSDRIVVLVAVYYYLPPPGRGLVAQVPEHALLGFATVYGLATLVGRLFDGLADPVVGHLSDRSRSRRGRRRALLIAGVGPMVAVPPLLFFPPAAPGSAWNGVWLAALLSVYFIAFTAYVAPYFALLPEIAWTQAERLRLSQWMSFCSLPVLGFFTAWGVGIDLGRHLGLTPEASIRWLVVLLSASSLLLCAGPILAVDERRHARGARVQLAFRTALGATLRNRPFLVYLLAQLFFILAVNLVQPAFPYLATVILGRSEGFTLWFSLGAGAGLALGFAVQRRAVERFGARRTMMGCVGLMALALAPLGLLQPDVPGGPRDAFNLRLCLGALGAFGVAAAGLLVLPHVLIGQLVDEDERRTGASRAAMFFGVQGLLTKWMYGVSLWVFTWLLSRFGNSPDAPGGVVLVGPVAALCALLALGCYGLYPERRVLGASADDA